MGAQGHPSFRPAELVAGFRSGRSDDAIDIATRRVRDAEAIQASMLVTSCPFCLRNLQDGATRINSKIEVISIESLIASLLAK